MTRWLWAVAACVVAVLVAANGRQIPWESTSLEEDFWFLPPKELRDAHYAGAKKLGHGQGYIYPHDDPAGFDADVFEGTARVFDAVTGHQKAVFREVADLRQRIEEIQRLEIERIVGREPWCTQRTDEAEREHKRKHDRHRRDPVCAHYDARAGVGGTSQSGRQLRVRPAA